MIFIKKNFIKIISNLKISKFVKAELIADLCRINTLSMIKVAGSGHIGTSMSAMDIFVWVKFFIDKTPNFKDPNRNILFSSKGHDVPALYSVLYAIGVISLKKLLLLRRLNGLDGHPDVSVKGIETNTGSLGMGISKAKGFAWSKKYLGSKGLVIVITGDGEFQEGQIFEALQTTAHQKINNIIVIIDHNKIQSSKYVDDIINLRDVKKKVETFGWHVEVCNGHNFEEIDKKFSKLNYIKNKPKLIIANTIKGKGIKNIEHTIFMKKNKSYLWHSGSPSDIQYKSMINGMIRNLNKKLIKYVPSIKIEKKYIYIHSTKNISLDIH
jgi:transketolase